MRSFNQDLMELVVEEIIEAAEKAGVHVAGDRRNQGGLQPESVAMSVLKDLASKDMPEFKDDDHRRAYLYLAVKNKYIDRVRKRRHQQAEDGWAEARLGGREHDPLSRAMISDGVQRDVDGLQRLTDRLGACCNSDADRHMVSRVVLSNNGWSEIAAQIEKSAGAAKVTFHRLRPALLAAAIEPLKHHLNDIEWTICQRIFAERQRPEDVEHALDLKPGMVREVVTTKALPELSRLYGSVGYEVIVRLLGTSKSPPSPGRI